MKALNHKTARLLSDGLAHHQSGREDQAESLYLQAVAIDKRCIDASILLGTLYLQGSRYRDAELRFRDLLESVGPVFEASIGLGHALREQERFAEAINAYATADALSGSTVGNEAAKVGLAICNLKSADLTSALSHINAAISANSGNAEARVIRANTYAAMGEHYKALEDYSFAIAIDRENSSTWFNRGLLYKALHRYSEAVTDLEQSLRLDSSNTNAAIECALCLEQVDRLEEAADILKAVRGKSADNADALIASALIAHKRGEFEDAETFYNLAERLSPKGIELFLGRGSLYASQRRLVEAKQDFVTAASLDPSRPEAYFNLGAVQSALRDFSAAMRSYERALQIDQSQVSALLGLAAVLIEIRQYAIARKVLCKAAENNCENHEVYLLLGYIDRQEKNIRGAEISYSRALTIKPDAEFLIGEAFFNQLSMCEWSNWDTKVAEIESKINAGCRAILPFQSIAIFDSPCTLKKCAETYTASRFPGAERLFTSTRSDEKRSGRIKIAYFSADFYEHATTYLIAELLEAHDRSKFELIGYSFGSSPVDAMTSRIQIAFDQFFDVSQWSDDEVSQHCRQNGVDIAIDLKGHTFGSRPSIFANRCAPVQINYLGYPGTMGAKYIDFIFVDEFLVGLDDFRYYTETPVVLPHCYQPNCSSKLVDARVFTREQCGLPAEGIVLSSFNNNYKITPLIFDAWMTILREVPGSVLWLLAMSEDCKENIFREAATRGVHHDRLVFAGFEPHPVHLARLQLADLFLDTYPCSAHTTASDALWSGVPVLTLAGKTFASRVAASLLQELGLAELIARSTGEYIASAVQIGNSPEKLKSLKERLALAVSESKLFKPKEYVKSYEQALLRTLDHADMGKERRGAGTNGY